MGEHDFSDLANENFPRHTGGSIVLDGIGYVEQYMAEQPETFLTAFNLLRPVFQRIDDDSGVEQIFQPNWDMSSGYT